MAPLSLVLAVALAFDFDGLYYIVVVDVLVRDVPILNMRYPPPGSEHGDDVEEE